MNKQLILKSLNEINSLCDECKELISSDNNHSEQIKTVLTAILAEAQKAKKESENNVSIPQFSGKRILIVEDNNVNLMVAQAFLKKTGCDIEIAENGKDAIDKINDSVSLKPFDLVLMDMQMPVMTGSEAVSIIRKMDQSSYPGNLKIVAMTGNVMEKDIEKAYAEGFSDYITKPIAAGNMYEKCAALLNVSFSEKNNNITPTGNNPVTNIETEAQKEIQKNIISENTSKYPDLSSKKILVVDDNKLNVEILNLMLKKTGASYDNAYDGTQALDIFLSSKENTYDMILMDIQMPEMDGNTCAGKIRSSKRCDSNLPIIAISANAFQEDKEKSLNAGINFHMSKPVNMKILHKKIEEMLLQNHF